MVTVITGAAQGLGHALATACIARGDTVLAIDIVGTAPTGAHSLQLDLTSADAASQIAQALPGPCDLFIHCAGISGTGKFEDIPADHHARIIALNFTAPMQITCALLGAQSFSASAKIAFVGSLSTFTGYPGATSYAASKDGLAAFARSLDKSLPKGQSAHCIFPGPLATDHAAKYAPDNSPQTVARRQSVDDAATLILRDLTRGKRTILPGTKAKAFAALGRIAPRLVERALVKSLFADMDHIRV